MGFIETYFSIPRRHGIRNSNSLYRFNLHRYDTHKCQSQRYLNKTIRCLTVNSELMEIMNSVSPVFSEMLSHTVPPPKCSNVFFVKKTLGSIDMLVSSPKHNDSRVSDVQLSHSQTHQQQQPPLSPTSELLIHSHPTRAFQDVNLKDSGSD